MAVAVSLIAHVAAFAGGVYYFSEFANDTSQRAASIKVAFNASPLRGDTLDADFDNSQKAASASAAGPKTVLDRVDALAHSAPALSGENFGPGEALNASISPLSQAGALRSTLTYKPEPSVAETKVMSVDAARPLPLTAEQSQAAEAGEQHEMLASSAPASTAAISTSQAESEAAMLTPPRFKTGSSQNPKPVYPMVARKRGWQGDVLLEVEVGPDGRSQAVTVIASSGYQVLDNAALKTIRDKWVFEPATEANYPTQGFTQVPVSFRFN